MRVDSSLKTGVKKFLQPLETYSKMQSGNKKTTAQMLNSRSANIANNIVNSANLESALRQDFVKTLIYPDQYGSRMPDELTQPTVLYRSVREFALIANMDGTVNAGKFSFAVKPILGDLNQVTQYQVGIVNPSFGWPTDFSVPSSYVSQNLYSDPRIDPMAAPLLSSLPGQFFTTTHADDQIYSGSATQRYGQFFAGADNATGNTTTIRQTALQIPHNLGSSLVYQGVTYLEPTYWHFPEGIYSIHPYFHINGGLSSTTGYPLMMMLAVDLKNQVDGYVTFQHGSTTVVNGYFVGNYQSLVDWEATIYNTSQSLIDDISFNFRSDGNHRFVFAVALPVGQTVTDVYSGLIIDTTYDSSLPVTANSGSVVKIRPLACSALVTCTLPELTAGGNIIGYSAPPGDIDNYYYRTSSVMGPYQDWQNLARNNKGLNTHDGNFKDGTYVWTQPWDLNDTLMRTPTEAVEYAYQGIIISGQVNPTVQLSGMVEIGRIRIIILYEYITDNRLFLGESCFGTSNDLGWCLSFLASHQHAMENNEHAKKLKNIVQSAARWVTKSVPTMKKGLEMASGIAKLVL